MFIVIVVFNGNRTKNMVLVSTSGQQSRAFLTAQGILEVTVLCPNKEVILYEAQGLGFSVRKGP